MKKYKKLLVILVVFIFCPKNVKALLCENIDKVRYKDLAKNISYSYDAVEKNGDVKFTVTFSNIPKEFAIKNVDRNEWYGYKNSELKISNLESNKNYRFDVYVESDDGCDNLVMYTFNINLPYYNKYYTDSLCNGIEQYKLCQKWVNTQYTYEEWKRQVNKYRDSLKQDIQKEEEVKNKSWLEKIVEFYGQTYYIILPLVILIGGITIYVYNKKRELF